MPSTDLSITCGLRSEKLSDPTSWVTQGKQWWIQPQLILPEGSQTCLLSSYETTTFSFCPSSSFCFGWGVCGNMQSLERRHLSCAYRCLSTPGPPYLAPRLPTFRKCIRSHLELLEHPLWHNKLALQISRYCYRRRPMIPHRCRELYNTGTWIQFHSPFSNYAKESRQTHCCIELGLQQVAKKHKGRLQLPVNYKEGLKLRWPMLGAALLTKLQLYAVTIQMLWAH